MSSNTKTLVLDIQELYNVIPACKKLEGKNFKDVRELLKELIAGIEVSNEWEFIQYVNNKPSLFVIRKVNVGSTFESKHLQEASNILNDVKKIYEKVKRTSGESSPFGHSESAPYPSVEPVQYDDYAEEATPVFKTEEMEEVEKQVDDLATSVPHVKLPWE